MTKVDGAEEVKIAEKNFEDGMKSLGVLEPEVSRLDFNKAVRRALMPSHAINLRCSRIHGLQQRGHEVVDREMRLELDEMRLELDEIRPSLQARLPR